MALLPLFGLAQENQESNTQATTHDDDFENGIVSMSGKTGLKISSGTGDFVFKPFMLVQTCAKFNYYDDEGLDKAYNQDNVANSGFAVPYAVLGFTGKAFGKVTFSFERRSVAPTSVVRRSNEKEHCVSHRKIQNTIHPRISHHVVRNIASRASKLADSHSDSAVCVECRHAKYRIGF